MPLMDSLDLGWCSPRQLKPPAGSKTLDHPAAAPVLLRIPAVPAATDRGAHVAAADQVGLTIGVVHQNRSPGGIPADHQAPVAATRRSVDGTLIEPAHGHRDPLSQLGDQLLGPAVGAQFRLDAQAAQGLDLGRRLGGVAMAP